MVGRCGRGSRRARNGEALFSIDSARPAHETCFMNAEHFSTGLPGLDRVLRGILPGDNVVWQVDNPADYQSLVKPYAANALKSGKPLVYFRFAAQPPLLDENGVEIHAFNPEEGFETFVAAIHRVIRETGRGAYYVFDCLSELAERWYSDQMLGNFFKLTCPYLFDLETLAYFALFRNQHSYHAVRPITETTQLFLDVYYHEGRRYIRPLKVQHRYSATMNMLHAWGEQDNFSPVSESTIISEILTSAKWSGLHSDRRPGFWERAFIEAQEVLDEVKAGLRPAAEEQEPFERLLSMVVTRDKGIRGLARRYLALEDVLDVRRRMIGTGLVGGKTVGMLLARAILKQKDPRFAQLLEAHDSFFIGSDVFYTYLVRNGIWWARQEKHDSEAFYENATRARRLIITGTFPERTVEQFQEMLDYFGQSPFIVRSSSLLEDNYGNAFAGKYESVFCANQGPRAQRLEDFLAAVRTIYASAMSERALRYRARRGMLDKDEQMALLVMRVSGKMYGRNFYPPVAGVGFSFNPYVWSDKIDPQAGVIRLVFGLGTRAVDRSDDDYTRLVALNAPDTRPEHSFDQVKQYAQRRADYIDLEANHLASGYFRDLLAEGDGLPVEFLTSVDTEAEARAREMRAHGRRAAAPRVLTFDGLLTDTGFVADMRDILRVLQEAYDYPVDIEFTVNFDPHGSYKINLLQCRPLQVQGTEQVSVPVVEVSDEDRIIAARSAVIGRSRVVNVDCFIYVVPAVYGRLPIRERYEVARLLGDVNRALKEQGDETIVLLGPGRWGTSSPSLGIPVAFSDINAVSILCEIVAMRDDLIPDVSLGTHFLNELVEMDMLYLALFPTEGGNYLNEGLFLKTPSKLLELAPSAAKWQDAVKVVAASDMAAPGRTVALTANAIGQKVDCYFADRVEKVT